MSQQDQVPARVLIVDPRAQRRARLRAAFSEAAVPARFATGRSGADLLGVELILIAEGAPGAAALESAGRQLGLRVRSYQNALACEVVARGMSPRRLRAAG